MKKIFTLLYIIAAFSAKGDSWTQKADFPGTNRIYAFTFSIGNKGYVGGGVDSLSTWQFYHYTNDLWEYDQGANSWTQKADYPGLGRSSCVSFSFLNKGYAGLGNNNVSPFWFNDFWEYDAPTNVWTQKANFNGPLRQRAFNFSLNNRGYFGGGDSAYNSRNDLWEYDPIADIWTEKNNIPVTGYRHGLIGLTIGNKGYIGFGYDSIEEKDFWEYDPLLDSWSQKADGTPREPGLSFSLGNQGFVGLWGQSDSDLWEYKPLLNQWFQKANFPGILSSPMIYLSIGNKGYIGMGGSIIFWPYKQFWEYTSDSSTGIEELPSSNLEFTISPNPAKEFTVCNFQFTGNKKINIIVTDVNGKKVFATQTKTSNFKLQTSNFSNGIYFVEASDGKEKGVRKFLKE